LAQKDGLEMRVLANTYSVLSREGAVADQRVNDYVRTIVRNSYIRPSERTEACTMLNAELLDWRRNAILTTSASLAPLVDLETPQSGAS
jgi:hypothetical protein